MLNNFDKMENKKESFLTWSKPIVQVLLILGIIFLAYNDKDGWGWLIFALVFMK